MFESMRKLFEIIKDLIDNKFYGKLEIKFENGNITFCKKEETLKL